MSQAGALKIKNGGVPGDVPISFVTDAGTAVSVGNVLNVIGSTGNTTTGAGNTLTIKPTSFVTDIGTAVPNANSLTVQGAIGSGSTINTFAPNALIHLADDFCSYDIAGTTSGFFSSCIWDRFDSWDQATTVSDKNHFGIVGHRTIGAGNAQYLTLASDGGGIINQLVLGGGALFLSFRL